MPDPVVITARGIGKCYRIWTHSRPTTIKDRAEHLFTRRRTAEPPRQEDIWALRDVSFDVHRGEVLGVIGPNGAGKSTLLSILARITEPTTGRIEIQGRLSSLLEVGTGFHPELSGRDNIFLNGAILGMNRREVAERYDEIVEFSGVGEFVDMPVKRYSSGMYVRLAFSIAAHLEPEVLLLDEVLAVGDHAFQEKCLARIARIVRSGHAVIFVSHDVASVSRLCDRAIVLNHGGVAFDGDVDEAVAAYLDATPLGARSDAGREREGTGEVRVERISLSSESGQNRVVPGSPIEIRVDLHGTWQRHMGPLRLQLEIRGHGGTLVLLSTDYDAAHRLESLAITDRVTALCRLEDLPLKPGQYIVSATLKRAGGEIVDRAIDAYVFTTLPSDYFGTGIMADETYSAPLLVRHRWDVSPQAAADVAVEEAIG